MTQSESLQEAIKNLSSKKHVLQSDTESSFQENDGGVSNSVSVQQKLILNELRQSMRLLMSFFQTSKFDELLCLLAQPFRLLLLNFIMGFLRGLGFALAMLVVLFMGAYFFYPRYLSFLF